MHTQLSLLGGSSESDPNKRYRSARYDFGAGPVAPTEFFAHALLRHIRPDRLIVLGTPGSMWDVLLESFGLGDAHDKLLLELIDAAASDATDQAQLDRLAPLLAAALDVEVRLRLIPYGRTLAEQIAILRVMAADIAPASDVSLDLTHGLRHLPMLAQMSALYLRKAKNVEIRGIYYGALDLRRDGVTPVMDLKGLLHMADWVGALHSFDKDGDYGVFEPLLRDDLGDTAGLLRDAAFYERSSRPGDARGKLRQFRKALATTPPTGIGALFTTTLDQRIGWIDGQDQYHRQRTLAQHYLASADYLRAAIMGFEAFLTRQVRLQQLGDAQNHDIRRQAKDRFEDRCRRGLPICDDYYHLRALRNALAHGDRNNQGSIQAALSSPQKLAADLAGVFERLLPEAET